MAEQIFDTNPTKQVLVDYAAKSLAPYTLLDCITDSSYAGLYGMSLINSYMNASIFASSQGNNQPGLKDGQYMVIWDSKEGEDNSASKFKLLTLNSGSSGQGSGSGATTVFGGDGGIYDRVKYAENLYITPENVIGSGSNVPEGKYIPYIQQANGSQTTMYLPAPDGSTGNQALIFNSSTGIGWGAAGAILNSVGNDSNPYYLIGATASSVESLNGTAPSNLYFNQGVFFKSGALYHTSDESLKTFITDIDINFDNLATIKKGFFYWNEDPDKIVNVGVSAQSVEALYPQLVTTEMGFKAVDYSKLGVIALAAIDKLYERIQDLEKQIETLKKSKN